MEEKAYFRNEEGLKLCGVLTKPKKDTEKCIVLCHGITVDKDEDGIFTELAQRLTKVGFAVFRFDFRGHGESEGNSVDMTINREKRDIEAAIKYLKGIGYVEFGIVAASFAGGPVLFYCGENLDSIKVLVLWNALIDYSMIINPSTEWGKKYWGNLAFERAKKFGFTEIDEKGFKIGEKLMNEIKSLKPYRELQELKIPILFIHGDRDTHVPYRDSMKYSNLLKTAELETIYGAEHGFHDNKKHAEQSYKATVEFLLKNLASIN